jgi:FMN-dependent NADH-azoreductase
MKILHIDSSVTGAKSISRPLTKATVEKLLENNPDATVVRRDLIDSPLSHYTAVLRLFGADDAGLTPEQKLELATGREVLEEFLAADVVVVGAPMYNFNIPSQLKAWIDHLCVAGVTFKYSSAGPEGQLGGKKIIIVSSRGGKYGPGSPYEQADFQEKYLKTVFGFLGVKDLIVVRAEGIGSGPEAIAAAQESAKGEIAAITW